MLDARGDARGLGVALLDARRQNLQPPPKLSLSAWAGRYAVLSRVTHITVMKSARVGYTKILDHVISYFIHQDPSPILAVQPRVEDAEDYSKSEIAPMLRDTPVLSALAGDPKAKDSAQTILKKTFSNGASLTLVGANSPGGFRRITARLVLFDEVDGYPAGGAGTEGDQIALGIKRSETFWNRKIMIGSTPTIKGISRMRRAMPRATSGATVCRARTAARCSRWCGAGRRCPTVSNGRKTHRAMV